MSSKIDRRNFIQLGALSAAGIALGVSTSKTAAEQKKKKVKPSDRITVGMIAVGARAQQMMANINNIPESEIVAVCDAYAGRVERAISRTGGRAVDMKNYESIISDPSIDVVVISSPDHLHAKHVIDAMNKGKHIYIEKPLTYTTDEGVEIIKAQRKNNVAVQVGSSGISSALARKAKEIIASGKLGQITMIRASYNRNTASGAWVYPIPPDANPKTVDWDMFLGHAPKRDFDLERFFRWRCYQDYSGGMSTDLFVHLCNTIHYIMGVEMCSSAIGMGALYRWKESRDVPDTLNASLEYPEGFMVNLSGTFNNSNSDDAGGVRILGTEGTLVMGRELTFIPENVVNDNGWIVDSWPRKLQEDYYNDPKIKEEERPGTWSQRVIPGTETYVSRGIDSTTAHFQDLFDSIKNGSFKTIEDSSVGHHAAACAHMVNVSIEKGRIIHWDKTADNIKAT
jgi:predicted dehydrogenase